jgi:hypothetical protein
MGSSTKQRATESRREVPEKRKQRTYIGQQRRKHTRQSQQKLAAAAAVFQCWFCFFQLLTAAGNHTRQTLDSSGKHTGQIGVKVTWVGLIVNQISLKLD